MTHGASASEGTDIEASPYDAGIDFNLRGCLPNATTVKRTREGAGRVERNDLLNEARRNYGNVDSITKRGGLNRITESTRCHSRTY